jgi:hypothetical protein
LQGTARSRPPSKYLTQSTWSHAPLNGGALGPPAGGEEPRCLIEIEVGEGCIAAPSELKYYMRNIIDSLRHLIPITTANPLRRRNVETAVGYGS